MIFYEVNKKFIMWIPCVHLTWYQRLNCLSDFDDIWYRSNVQKFLITHEFCDSRLRDSCTLIKGISYLIIFLGYLG